MGGLIIFAVLVVGTVVLVGILLLTGDGERKQRLEALSKAQDDFEKTRQSLFETLTADWEYKSLATVNREHGFIAMDSEGKNVRLGTFVRDDTKCELELDETFPRTSIRQIEVHQPEVARTIVHNEQTPVAIREERSSGGRALIGGLVAGPTGAIVGGFSGPTSKTKIKQVAVQRHETVYRKAHPALILHVSDLSKPRRSVILSTVEATNEWASRIHHAITK